MKLIYTIGVYNKSEEEFFQMLLSNNIEVFYDVRNRRGMRGKKYSFVNSKYLQEKLSRLNVEYFHLKELSPGKSVRNIQAKYDKFSNVNKRQRIGLSKEFCNAYEKEVLTQFDVFNIKLNLGEKNIVLFCVEDNPNACHRSLITKRLLELNPQLHIIHL